MVPSTDKITVHGYYPAYQRIASALGPSARVCELGVQGGGSLLMWQQLFPEGEITGVDSNPGCIWPPGTRRVVAGHDDPELPSLLGELDLIVDDGGHHGPVVTRSFSLLWPLVSPGGFYVIEDWMVSLRDAERPGETWGRKWNPFMLHAVQDLLLLLDYPDSECDSVTYRYGLAIAHKRNSE